MYIASGHRNVSVHRYFDARAHAFMHAHARKHALTGERMKLEPYKHNLTYALARIHTIRTHKYTRTHTRTGRVLVDTSIVNKSEVERDSDIQNTAIACVDKAMVKGVFPNGLLSVCRRGAMTMLVAIAPQPEKTESGGSSDAAIVGDASRVAIL